MKPKYPCRILIGVILSLVLCCCNHSDNVDECPVITLNQSDKIEKIDLADISDSYLAFKPETTDESIISNICRVWHYKSCVYILDHKYQILVFDESGKYLWKLNKRGQGPGEYTRLLDFAIDQKHDYLLLLAYNKILRYDLKGNYIDTISTGDGYEIATDGKYAYVKPFDEENGEAVPYSLRVIDLETSKETDVLTAVNDCAPSCYSDMRMLTSSNGRVLFSRKFDSKIYLLSDGQASAEFDIDWGESAFPNTSDKKFDCKEYFKLSRENNYISSVGDMIMSDSLCLFRTNINSYGLIDRAGNTIKLAKNLSDTRLFANMPLPRKSISIDSDLPEIAVIINTTSAKFFALKCADPEIAATLGSMGEEDNPLLIISVLK